MALPAIPASFAWGVLVRLPQQVAELPGELLQGMAEGASGAIMEAIIDKLTVSGEEEKLGEIVTVLQSLKRAVQEQETGLTINQESPAFECDVDSVEGRIIVHHGGFTVDS